MTLLSDTSKKILNRTCQRCRGYLKKSEVPKSGWCSGCRDVAEVILEHERVLQDLADCRRWVAKNG